MTVERDAYAVLQVDPRATRETISRAYRVLARRFHPDGATPNQERMAEINRAYDRVKTPAARACYDAARGTRVAVRPGRPVPVTTPPTPRPGGIRARRAATEDHTVIDFGRYVGWRIVDLARVDPDYLRWLSRHSSGLRYRDAIGRSLPGDLELGRRASILG